MLHGVIRDHFDDFLRAAAEADGAGLPEFVAREFREFLTCGVPMGHVSAILTDRTGRIIPLP